MVFGIFSKKIDRVRIYQDVRRVEQHFQNTILGVDPPVESIIDEFDSVLEEIARSHTPAMLEPLLRLEELSAGIVSSYYASRICARLRGNLRRHFRNDEIALYEAACRKHFEFLSELGTIFYPEIIRNRETCAIVANRQFHWLCELTKISCIHGAPTPDEYFESAEGLLAFGDEQGITDEVVAPYRNLYPEEKASLGKNKIRQYLLTTFLNSELPGSDIDVANTLWRIMPLQNAHFTSKKSPEVTHFIMHGDSGRNALLRIYPELAEESVGLWFCGLRLASEMRQMVSKAQKLVQETALGELFSQVISEKSIERVAFFFSASQTRENKRIAVRMDTEVFTEIIDCICYLRRVNEDFLMALSDVDEKRKFNIHEQFEEMNFGYVAGHVNQMTRATVNEGIAKTLKRKMEAEYANCGKAPAIWRIDDVSSTGYGLILPKGTKPPETAGIVILSRENEEGIEFAVARRYSSGKEKNILGVELLYPGCDVDPFFIVKCYDDGAYVGGLADPYGFLLTGNPPEGAESEPYSIMILSKKTRLPQRCTLRIRTLDNTLEGWLAGTRSEGFNWVAYQWKPV